MAKKKGKKAVESVPGPTQVYLFELSFHFHYQLSCPDDDLALEYLQYAEYGTGPQIVDARPTTEALEKSLEVVRTAALYLGMPVRVEPLEHQTAYLGLNVENGEWLFHTECAVKCYLLMGAEWTRKARVVDEFGEAGERTILPRQAALKRINKSIARWAGATLPHMHLASKSVVLYGKMGVSEEEEE
jgi:hypothetical protein